MTEGPLLHHDKPMCVRVWLEVGHACEPRRSALGRALALDWRVWVRGVSGRDISGFVHKVVFHLHPAAAFVYPKRVLQEPPYEVQESGCASIEIPIHVYLKFSSRPKKIRLRYSLQIENSTRSSSESRCVYYDFENPSEQLCRALMEGGGEMLARAGALGRGRKLLLVLAEEDKPHKLSKAKKYHFIEPIQCKHGPKKRTKSYIVEEVCSKCGESTTLELRRQLRTVELSEEEAGRVSQLYLACSRYERAAHGLKLPLLSDPIFRVPELSAPLREALAAVPANNAP